MVLLETQSLANWRVDDALSKKLLTDYVTRLDPDKLYFLDSDWREFQKRESSLDDQLKSGDLSFVKLVSERLKARTAETRELTQRALQAKHDFTLDEAWPFPYEGFAADRAQLADRWRLRIKGEILFERANHSTSADALLFLRGRYESVHAQFQAATSKLLGTVYLDTLCKICSPNEDYWSDDFMPRRQGPALRVTYTSRLWLDPAADRLVVRAILPPHDDLHNLREVLGWHVVAIHAGTENMIHTVGIQYQNPESVSDLWRRLNETTDVTLELQHPISQQRKSITWTRFAITRKPFK